jgi:RNA polymerase-interacting CarD/CdnL/TRCF family regulator
MKRLAINWSNSDTVEVVDDPHGPFVRAKEAEAVCALHEGERESLHETYTRTVEDSGVLLATVDDLKRQLAEAVARAEKAERERDALADAGDRMAEEIARAVDDDRTPRPARDALEAWRDARKGGGEW